jgi:molecular chaperone GrpE (heat shock protein)
MKDVFQEAGIEVTASNKKKLDQAIHQAMAVTYKDCPTTWRKIKQEILTDATKRQNFIQNIKSAMS